MNKFLMPCLAIAASLAVGPALATTYDTIDLTAVDGSSWNELNSAPVRVDFGSGLGIGTIALTPINGGTVLAFGPKEYITPPQLQQYTGTLSNGDTVVADDLGTGTIITLSASQPADFGYTLTFSLDSGSFVAGSLLNIGDLRQNDGSGLFANGRTLFNAGTSFGAPDSALLPSMYNGTLSATAVSTDASGTTYGAATVGTTATQAYSLLRDVNSFSVSFLTTPVKTKGLSNITFSFATASAPTGAVPEPATWAMMIVGFGATGCALRRRAKFSFS